MALAIAQASASVCATDTTDEESSGIIDGGSMLGDGWFLMNSQAHYGIAGELVQGGQ